MLQNRNKIIFDGKQSGFEIVVHGDYTQRLNICGDDTEVVGLATGVAVAAGQFGVGKKTSKIYWTKSDRESSTLL